VSVSFHIGGDSLIGRGLSFDVSAIAVKDRAALADMANAIYRSGRESALQSYDDRAALYSAVETLRALSVVVGWTTGDRHRNAADVIARMLEAQSEENP
jgi:hypothetical protein